ncbi:hypothetical protein [Planctobacterium marinum]|uniref:hypothetical protein n=1 Tax=Planctobacterium marinum TaxID=1631968 RepID=UPI001E45404C|nr:hypothetical protein [Planctobacterium marinum]MCC2606784.1 hypothetical protein [Planctobacterium marinum]
MSTTNYFSDNRAAKILASLMLIQMAMGLILNFHFLKPILRFDGSATSEELNFILGCATLVALLISSINLIFALLLPKERVIEHTEIFVPIIVFATAGITLCAVEYARLAEYVTFLTSTDFINDASNDPTLTPLKEMLATGRNEAHFISIFISSFSLIFFYGLMLRAKMLPSLLAGFALMAVVLQLIAVSHTFFALSIPNIIQAPLALTQLIVPIYLILFGFRSIQVSSTNNTEQFS